MIDEAIGGQIFIFAIVSMAVVIGLSVGLHWLIVKIKGLFK